MSLETRDRRDPIESAVVDPRTKDPTKHYRFFHTSDNRIARAKALGYKPVMREDGVKLLTDQDEDDGTGTIVHGDRVLFSVPKEKYEQRRMRRKRLAQARLRGPADRFREKADRAGVDVAAQSSRREPDDEE